MFGVVLVFDGRKAKKKEYKQAHYKLTRFAEYPCRLTFGAAFFMARKRWSDVYYYY
jgi:hypothetical protein